MAPEPDRVGTAPDRPDTPGFGFFFAA